MIQYSTTVRVPAGGKEGRFIQINLLFMNEIHKSANILSNFLLL